MAARRRTCGRPSSDAETELLLGSPDCGGAALAVAERPLQDVLAGRPADLRAARRSPRGRRRGARRRRRARVRGRPGDGLDDRPRRGGGRGARPPRARGDVAAARSWLLVREFRPPTRFTRAAADATLALDRLASGGVSARDAAAAVRTDLLDTYDGRLRASLASVREATPRGLRRTRRRGGRRCSWLLGDPAPGVPSAARAPRRHAARRRRARRARRAHGCRRWRRHAAASGSTACSRDSGPRRSREEELVRRAGQLDRFLRLVPIEYGRGVADGARHEGLRDPGGDHVPRRRRGGVPRPRVGAPRARHGRHPQARGGADRARRRSRRGEPRQRVSPTRTSSRRRRRTRSG